MSLSWILLAIAAVVLSSSCEARRLRIRNGKQAAEGQFPYQALVMSTYGGYCGASIIHKRWLLTAAHCYQPPTMRPKVHVGTNLLYGPPGVGKTYPVDKFITHKDFMVVPEEENNGLEFVVNDIALIRIVGEMEFNDKIQPVKLPTDPKETYEGTLATLSGWGRTAYHEPSPMRLRYVSYEVMTPKDCQKVWTYTAEKHLCTSPDTNRGGCYGDSGGPLVNEDGVQIGVISTADTYCESKKPDLFARVSAFLPWIQEQMAVYNDVL